MKLINEESSKSGSLSISRMCEVLSINRNSYYKWLKNRTEKNNKVVEESKLHIEKIKSKLPFYGYRRVTKQLNRDGIRINHKKVLSIMRS